MRTIICRLFWTIPVLIPLVCLLVIGWKTREEAARQPQNRALIEAVKADKADDVIRLLADGADANCRDIPPDTQTFWEKLRALFYPVRPDNVTQPSVLQLAVARGFYPDREERPETIFAIIKALHDAGANAEGDAPQFYSFLTEQEQMARLLLAKMPVTPGDTYLSIHADSLIAHLKQHGMSARAYAAIGRCELRDNSYTDAIFNLAVAHLWLPEDRELAAELAQAEEWNRLAKRLTRKISHLRRGVSLCPFPDEQGQILWAALSYQYENDYGFQSICLDIYRVQDGGFKRLDTTGTLKAPTSTNNPTEAGGDYGNLYLLRITGRLLPEIVVTAVNSRSVSGTSQLNIYEWRDARLRCLLKRSSDEPIDVVDLRHDGRAEIVDYWETGGAIPHVTPRRANVYAFREGKFAVANAEFPDAFQSYISATLKALRQTPSDLGLMRHLAYIYSLTGNRREAEDLRQRAERICRRQRTKAASAKLTAACQPGLQQRRSRDAGKR